MFGDRRAWFGTAHLGPRCVVGGLMRWSEKTPTAEDAAALIATRRRHIAAPGAAAMARASRDSSQTEGFGRFLVASPAPRN